MRKTHAVERRRMVRKRKAIDSKPAEDVRPFDGGGQSTRIVSGIEGACGDRHGRCSINRRAAAVLTTLLQAPGHSYPGASVLWAATKGAYAFVNHKGVTPDSIIAAHRTPLIERCRGEREVLVIGDTTEFDFIKRHKTEGLLGPSQSRSHRSRSSRI